MTFTGILFVYVLGGLTFLPLLVAAVLLHAYLTFPERNDLDLQSVADAAKRSSLERPNDDEFSLKSGTDLLAEKFNRKHEGDVAAGYFAVCREYVPGGVNGKPPERTTPAGEIVAAESPSVYQSMYRSIFDRKEKPSIEPTKAGGRSVKKANNVFYVVLRHGHLMLYDDSEQIEVRHVISLEYHDVSIYGGGEEIPEGELWVKRNSICLRKKRPSAGDMGVTSLPFYLFSENQSDKEDFYFALLNNQQKIPGFSNPPPAALQFDTKDIIKLVQQLHSSQEHLQTRWLNALLGRLFLGLYKTPEVEAFFRKKIAKKISRIKKPNFITRIVLRKIEMGDNSPFFTNPRLRDLTVDGDTTVEADVKYAGNFRIEIGATARIDLGQRFKAREVELVLAVVARKLEGHGFLRVKPPPSNRVWISFETMPTVEMTVEPIVSTRQITYSVIIRAIESKIREVIAESVVLPYWDDIPFFETQGQEIRGGIWKQEPIGTKHEEIKEEDAEDAAEPGDIGEAATLKQADERTMSVPTIPPVPQNVKLRGNKSNKSLAANGTASASSTGVDKTASVQAPRAIRSNSFATPADPMVTTDNAGAASVKRESLNTLKKDAAAAMKELTDRSLSTSPSNTSLDSHKNEMVSQTEKEGKDTSSLKETASTLSTSRTGSVTSTQPSATQASLPSNPSTAVSESGSSTPPKRSRAFASWTGSLAGADKGQSLAGISAATAAAKKWSLGMVSRGDGKGNEANRPGTPNAPMGRGRPLPPPGQPLPPPDRGILSSLPALPKRKAIPPRLPERKSAANGTTTPDKPPLPERRRQRSIHHIEDNGADEVFVVEAPTESAPASPSGDGRVEFFGESEEGDTSKDHEELQRPPLPPRASSDVVSQSHDTTDHAAEDITTNVEQENHEQVQQEEIVSGSS